MQKFKLELILAPADEPALQYHHSDESRVVESPAEPSAPIEAVKQYGCVFLRFTGWPSHNINVLGSEHQNTVLKLIELLNHFASVDIPDLGDLFAQQFSEVYHREDPDFRYASGRTMLLSRSLKIALSDRF
jgi:hypothetical protein